MSDFGAKNAVMGEDFGTEIPIMQAPEADLSAEKNAARFAQSKEYKILKDYMEARIKFFQTFLPDGKEVRFELPDEDMALKWIVANNVINEFQMVLESYENAKEVVKNSKK